MSPAVSMTVLRWLCLIVPIAALAIAVSWRRPDRRTRGAALFAFITAAVGVAALAAIGGPLGWLRFADVDGSFDGLPVDVWIGWAILWGPLPVLVRTPLAPTIAVLGWLDAVLMPYLDPLVQLGPAWLVGEVIGLVGVALPAILLGRWMAQRRHLAARAVLQVVTVSALIGWLVPAMAIAAGDGSWRHLTELPRWALSLLVQLAAVLALPGLLAVREFAERGGGTPYPWDPPRRVVRTGPYAYVANPMQLSGSALLALMAAATRSWSVAATVVFAVAFSAAVATPHERDDLTRRHGAAWSAYRRGVRAWWPRWRPVLPPAQLYLARTCDVCSSTAGWLGQLGPLELRVRAAEEHPEALRRACYVGHDGYRAHGVAALARALEHVNLGWAALGWCLRLPGLDRIVQLLVDTAGGGPRDIRRAHGGHTLEAARRGHADHP